MQYQVEQKEACSAETLRCVLPLCPVAASVQLRLSIVLSSPNSVVCTVWIIQHLVCRMCAMLNSKCFLLSPESYPRLLLIWWSTAKGEEEYTPMFRTRMDYLTIKKKTWLHLLLHLLLHFTLHFTITSLNNYWKKKKNPVFRFVCLSMYWVK